MPFDAHKNLAIATVVTAPSPAASGTSLTVGAGQGARFPAVPFNGTVWPFDMAPDPATAEVWRCTALAGDTLTLVRAQEGTTARAIIAGDLIAATITAKSLTDIESGVNFPLITTPGIIDGIGYRIGGWDALGYTGNTMRVGGLTSGQWSSVGLFTQGVERGRIHPSGGFSWGSTTDPGAGNLSVNGGLKFSGGFGAITTATTDGADTSFVQLSGAGAGGHDRAATVNLFGNEHAAGGSLQLYAGNVVGTGKVEFFTGASLLRGVIHPSGGFSWGGTTDPGAGAIVVGAGVATGETGTKIVPGTATMASAGTATAYALAFINGNGLIGSITTSGSATAYNTTSDARLKTPLTRHTDTAVLRDTVIHDFLWKSDGTAGRGVFAQEAHEVAPFAVSVGSDEVDAEGRLTHPWGVDYSKYVPDLITGWQHHDQQLAQLEPLLLAHAAELVDLKSEMAFLRKGILSARPSQNWIDQLYQRIKTSLAAVWPAWITP